MKVAGRKLMMDGADEQSGTIRGLNLAMALGRTGIRILGLALGPTLMLASAFVVASCQASLAQGDADLEAPGLAPFATPASPQPTLFQNVRIFDGRSASLSAPSNVLVRGNTIARISTGPITVEASANVRVIAANGRVLMPGLIDAHWHAFMAATPQMLLMTADTNYLQLLAAQQAHATLMRGCRQWPRYLPPRSGSTARLSRAEPRRRTGSRHDPRFAR